jgi:hypothetical protein
MRKYFRILFALGLIVSILLPALAFADGSDERGSCRLDSREFAYVSQSMEEKIVSLESDLKKNNIDDPALNEAIKKLVEAEQAVFKDAGKYSQEHDLFGYSAKKLEALRDSAMDYYNLASKLKDQADHIRTAYALQEMAILAVDEFAGQCNQTRRRTKKWMKKWNEIDNGASADEVTARFHLDEIVEQDAKQAAAKERKAKEQAEANAQPKKDDQPKEEKPSK